MMCSRTGLLEVDPGGNRIANAGAEMGALMDLRYRITVDLYHRMAELGLFGPEPRVELLEGVIVTKMTKNPPHTIATDLLEQLLHRLVPVGYFPSMANPVSIPERDSEPRPDAQVVRGAPRDYAGRRRGARDAALVIEVADTSYSYDRKAKWMTYAAARVPVYWLLDLNRRVLEVFDDPAGEGAGAQYRGAKTYGPDDEIALVLDGHEVARFFVREALP